MGRGSEEAGLPMSKFVFEAVEAFRAAKDETPWSNMVGELPEAKEEAQKLRSELKMKTMLLEKLEADVYKALTPTSRKSKGEKGPDAMTRS
jgi:hypothetical protein